MNRVGWGYVVFVVLLVVLHFVLRVGFGYEQLAPDLLVVALLLAARQLPAGQAAALGFFLGILEGALVPSALGETALALTIVGFVGARSRELFLEDSYVVLAVYLFAGKWLFDLILYTAAGDIFGSTASRLFLVSPLTALYAAAAGLIGLSVYRTFT
jgi:rod shape-determining protein MreD